MTEEIKENKNNNPLLNPENWVEVAKWIVLFLIAVIIPTALLAMSWIFIRPSLAVFIIITVLYLVLTILFMLPLIRNSNSGQEKTD